MKREPDVVEDDWKEYPVFTAWKEKAERNFDWSLPMEEIEKRYPETRIEFPSGTKRCAYCETKFLRDWTKEHNPEMRTIDHIHPVSKDGASGAANTTFVCYRCNQFKGSKTLDEFLNTTSNPIIHKNVSWFKNNFIQVKRKGVVFFKPNSKPHMSEDKKLLFAAKVEYDFVKFDIPQPANNIDAPFVNFHEN